MEVKVSKATEGDVYDLARISAEVACEGMVEAFKPEELRELVLSEKYFILSGRLGEEIVGYAISTYSWGKLHICDIAVKRDRRGMGIGGELVKSLVLHASEKGLTEVYCEVRARNISALNLFTCLGFRFRIFCPFIEGGFYGLYLPIQTMMPAPLDQP